METSHPDESRGSKGRLLLPVIGLLLFVFSILLLVKVIRVNTQLETFQDRQTMLSTKVDSLREVLRRQPSDSVEFPALLTEYDIRQLKNKGLADPVEDIRKDLMHSAGLIPLEGVLGGSMQFYEDQIYVLTDQWVLAYVDDGHVAGYLWLEYTVGSRGEISWEVKDAYIM